MYKTLLKLINSYNLLDEDSKHIIQYLSLSPQSENIDDILRAMPNAMTQAQLKSLIDKCVNAKFITQDNFYGKQFSPDNYLRVWVYPIINKNIQLPKTRVKTNYGYYYSSAFKDLANYLHVLCLSNKLPEIKEAETKLISYQHQISYLLATLYQPAYDNLFPKMSSILVGTLYDMFAKAVFKDLNSLDEFRLPDEKFKHDKSAELRCRQAEIAFKRGNFDEAIRIAGDTDTAISHFTVAVQYFLLGKMDDALARFEKGMKKQRRYHKNSYVPILPEAALFYVIAWMSKEQEAYVPVFNRIINDKTKFYTNVHLLFNKMCQYTVLDVKRAGEVASSLRIKHFNDKDELTLWTIIAMGFTGEKPDDEDFVNKMETLVRQAFKNGYLPAAYEAAYTLLQWEKTSDIRKIYEAISQQLGYQPALSRVKHMEEWEKQLNSYLRLEAVQSLIRKDNGEGKTRVAYRFFPKRNSAVPVLQSRQANGGWTSGRNIAIYTFNDRKVDCMTAQDKRIAEAHLSSGHSYSYELGEEAILAMVGHPHVLFEDSEIPVELVPAKPMLRVVASPKGGYKIESDIVGTRNGIRIVKETNTRYKVYEINRFQSEIIHAVTEGRKIPEQGREKLLEVLKYFGTVIDIQSDLSVDENQQTRQVETDSRIRVQMLPWSDGIKAELFVKPFGSHPPYCKPGRGGKVLIANENGERLQVTRNLTDEKKYGETLLNDIQSIENLSTADELMAFDNPLDSLELLDILQRHQDIAIVEWPEGERYKIRKTVDFGNLKMKITGAINWFELDGELKVDEETVLTVSTLLDLVRQGHGRFLELSNGEFLALSEQFRKRLSELSAYSTHSANGVTINRFASAS
ncbi:MAG: hypothetical protein LBR10_10380, partial [Prevotellaceae bacterium]|nr:hypothetical protein [Prevotellaceae bacterium]